MTRFALTLLAFLAFLLYSARVVALDGGFGGFFALVLGGGWGTQVSLDLCCALTFAMFWLVPDAKRLGVSPWPFVVALPFVGSISPLFYLVLREWKRTRRASATNG